MSSNIGFNSVNYNNCADWNMVNGNLTSVGTNGGPSSYGTVDQCGNIWEITETKNVDNNYVILGGSFNTTNNVSISCSGSAAIAQTTKSSNIGIRLCTSINSNVFGEVTHITGINTADVRTNKGSVDYDYYIGRNCVTNYYYVEFLNNVDPSGTNSHNLYSPLMSNNYDGSDNKRGGIIYNADNPIGKKYYTKNNFHNKPVNYVSFTEIAKLTNWLHNDQNKDLIYDGAYAIDGNTITKNTDAKYWIPSEDEWYKAAYYDPNKDNFGNDGYWTYATQSDIIPCCVGNLDCTSINVNNGDGSIANIFVTSTPTPTPTTTLTTTPTQTPTNTPTTTLTTTPTNTPTNTSTNTPTQTQTQTATQTPTQTSTQTPTTTTSNTATQTPTPTQTATQTQTPTLTPTTTPTNTPTPSITPSQAPVLDQSYLHTKYTIKHYPNNAIVLNLLYPPSGDPALLHEWNNFIYNIDTVYSNDSGKLLSFNTIVDNNGKSIPNESSDLNQLVPDRSYLFITKDYANFPIKIPIRYIDSLYISENILELLKQINLTESLSYKLIQNENKIISYDKIIKTLNIDINKYHTNLQYFEQVKFLSYILSEIEKEYISRGYGCVSVTEHTNEYGETRYSYNNKLSNLTYDFIPIINTDIPNTIHMSGLVNPINIILSNIPNDNNLKLTYQFIAKTGTQSCSIFPLSGTISPDKDGKYTISNIFEFHGDDIRSQESNLI